MKKLKVHGGTTAGFKVLSFFLFIYFIKAVYMFDDPITLILEKAVNGSALRHTALVNNISNINTPGYKRVDVDFKTSLSAAVKNLQDGKKNEALQSIKNSTPEILNDTKSSVRLDGNGVDIDSEMAKLAENTLEYTAYVKLLSKKFDGLRTVISEGKR
jgi:flagellar basal-body rod protein FlgB